MTDQPHDHAPGAVFPLQFHAQDVRMRVDEQGVPWWVADDVGEVLGIQNVRQNLTDFPENEKGVCNVYTLGGPQEVRTVNEPGLYRLIFQSRKPDAEAFKTWIVTEVLPTLRRTGAYTMPGVSQDPFLTAMAARITWLKGQDLWTDAAKQHVTALVLGLPPETATPRDGRYRTYGPEPVVLQRAVAWLRETLQHGPLPAHEVVALAAAEGIRRGSLRRAKRVLRVDSQRSATEWVWRLRPVNAVPDAEWN